MRSFAQRLKRIWYIAIFFKSVVKGTPNAEMHQPRSWDGKRRDPYPRRRGSLSQSREKITSSTLGTRLEINLCAPFKTPKVIQLRGRLKRPGRTSILDCEQSLFCSRIRREERESCARAPALLAALPLARATRPRTSCHSRLQSSSLLRMTIGA